MSRRTPEWHSIIRNAGLLAFLGFALAACAIPAKEQGVPPSPNARLYAYLMAHGMARGAVMSGQVRRQAISAIATADHTAQQAVFSSLEHPSQGSDDRADAAIAQLLTDISH